MKILVFSQMAGSAKHGMVYRNYTLAREWVRLGHDVTIVSSSFCHSRNAQPKVSGRVTEEKIDGIQYIWLLNNRYSPSSNVGRVLSMAIYTFHAWCMPLPLKVKYDVVIASSPTPFGIYPAYRYAKKYGARLVYDIRDLWPLTIKELGGGGEKHPFIRLMQRAEDFACLKADLVSAVPRNCESYLVEHGLDEGRFLHISNGASADFSVSSPLPESHQKLLSRLRGRGRFIVGYAGALGAANALHTLVYSLKECDTRIHVVLVGQGPYKSELAKLAEQLGVVERVHFLSPVSRDEVSSFLEGVNVTYAGTKKKELYNLGASLTKINDYMLASKPIVYAVGDPGNPVEESGCGVSCEAENVRQVALAINQLAHLPESDLIEMGEKGRNWCLENQMVEDQAALILDVLFNTPRRSYDNG